MSSTTTRSPAWSLFPPSSIPSTEASEAKQAAIMELHTPRRLSPIPQSEDINSNFGGTEISEMAFENETEPSFPKSPRDQSPRPARDNYTHAQRMPRAHDLSTLMSDLRSPHKSSFRGQERIPDRTSSRRQDDELGLPGQPVNMSGRSDFSRENSYASQHPELRRVQRDISTSGTAPSSDTRTMDTRSVFSDSASYHTQATSLPPLQQKPEEHDNLEPLTEEEIDPGCFDLVAPPQQAAMRQYSLEARAELLFSADHLKVIFADPSLLLRFTAYLSASKPSSIPILIYYLDAIKALKAISYANAIAEALDPITGFDFTGNTATKTINADLENKAKKAFEVIVREDLPAYITHTYLQTVSLSIQRRITGTLPSHLREASEGLAEVFCLTDPARPDNPIVFASEEFHRTTQYGMSYVLGRNCRFLQGPKTNPFSVRRIREKLEAGVEHCEVFLNYRRDGSPFMNLLMCAPLCDSRGVIRYFIGAQVDVSGLVKECSDLDSLKRLTIEKEMGANGSMPMPEDGVQRDEFQELSEMLNLTELDTVRKWGGRMHKEIQEDNTDSNYNSGNWPRHRVLISSGSPDGSKDYSDLRPTSGRLSGIYENYLLVRPYPSLKILFASPSLRVPGILQSPFMAKIGGSNRVREELTQAFADGRGVTAKIKWVTKSDIDGRSRWIHATPLIGSNGAIGVWMIVIVDDEERQKKFRNAPPVDPKFGRSAPIRHREDASVRDFAILDGGRDFREDSIRHGSIRSHENQSEYSLRID